MRVWLEYLCPEARVQFILDIVADTPKLSYWVVIVAFLELFYELHVSGDISIQSIETV